jgi:hypothetical protein
MEIVKKAHTELIQMVMVIADHMSPLELEIKKRENAED